jgi:hypothetical protein
MSFDLVHQVFNIAENHQPFYTARIITKLIAIGVLAPTYFGLSS